MPLETNTFYHIYNRGINGTDIFPEVRNYPYFLQKYAKYIQPVADTYAYCLLPNHFHLLVRVRPATEILANLPALVKYSAPEIAAMQFSHLFNGYAQAINKAARRTGNLLETPFRRIPVDTAAYFHELLYYIHYNPQRHGLVADFRDYPHSSYGAYLSGGASRLMRGDALRLAGGRASFDTLHQSGRGSGSPEFERDLVIEFD